jgi:predicted transposase YbfD/YdcC
MVSQDKTEREVSYGITSLTPEKAMPERLLSLLRNHWAIENSSHYVRDETLGEDRSRIRKGSGPNVMATIRNLVIAIIRFSGFKIIADGIRKFSWTSIREVIGCLGLAKA